MSVISIHFDRPVVADDVVNLRGLGGICRKGGRFSHAACETLPITKTVCARADLVGMDFGMHGGIKPTAKSGLLLPPILPD